MEKIRRTINCLIIDDEVVAREVIESHLAKIKNIHVVASCRTAMEAFQHISSKPIDLVFLDINMPEISGIAFAKSINKQIKIIFTTAYRDYAVEGFELQAVDYLLKPIALERLLQAVNTYFEVYLETKKQVSPLADDNTFMFVRSDRTMTKIDFSQIIYIESFSDYLKIHLTDKIVVTRETISAIDAKLPKTQFLRIHRSYIIAIPRIESFTNEYITIANTALSISRSYKNEVLKTLEQYF